MTRFEGERQAPQSQEKDEDEAPNSLLVRLGWFVVLWVASVAALAVVAYGIRLMIL